MLYQGNAVRADHSTDFSIEVDSYASKLQHGNSLHLIFYLLWAEEHLTSEYGNLRALSVSDHLMVMTRHFERSVCYTNVVVR
jgi:hypothetical protein